MKLSPLTFGVACHVCSWNPTLHELFSTLTKVDGVPRADAQQQIRDALAELATHGLITWIYEPDYGRHRGERPADFTESSFLHDWQRCVQTAPLDYVVPDEDHPTMTIQSTGELEARLAELGP